MKRALVTGGSGGIGAAICRRLASDGFSVVVHANSRLKEAQQLAAEITSAGGKAPSTFASCAYCPCRGSTVVTRSPQIFLIASSIRSLSSTST